MLWLATVGIAAALTQPAFSQGALGDPVGTIDTPLQETEITGPLESEPQPVLPQLLDEMRVAGFSKKAEIVARIAALDHPMGLPILKALAEGTLFAIADGPIVIALDGKDGEIRSASTGEVLQAVPGDLKKVRVNNKLRRVLRDLIARISLTSGDPDIRLAAAENAFTGANPETLPFIEEAIAAEQDPKIANALQQARAVMILASPPEDPAAVMDAMAVLKDRGDRTALDSLLRLGPQDDPTMETARLEAIEAIERTLSYWQLAQDVYFGISLGSVLLLAAFGLAVTFGVMGVINMAHGEMIMLGAYTAFVVQQVLMSVAPGLLEISLLLAIPAAFIVSGSAGMLIERTIIRFLYGRPLETLLATWGLSLILQQLIRSIFGPTNKPVQAPSWMSGSFEVGQLTITESRLWIIVFSLIVMGVLLTFIRRTRFGSQMRAVTQNRQMAESMGVKTSWVDALTFGLGSGVAGIAGVALSQIDNVSPNLGQAYIIDSFMVVVFGGVGNLWGTFVGAMSLGVANKLFEPFAGAVAAKILILIFIILFIQWRPRGLFALKGRFVDS
ncbi:urea ABC transporter permease subunit UrtB [Pyruvatibacter sp. HU-CL02332]|uniref:urea ABC transporter permease subunit UrtB n=1 Tax=Pyruvatibacter sp. HU-CL02332 TaxID=3127650 RepID=UPI00310AC5CD